jgi:hypothetical protein
MCSFTPGLEEERGVFLGLGPVQQKVKAWLLSSMIKEWSRAIKLLEEQQLEEPLSAISIFYLSNLG